MDEGVEAISIDARGASESRVVTRCTCWKPSAPGHQLDCPAGRESRRAVTFLKTQFATTRRDLDQGRLDRLEFAREHDRLQRGDV